MKNDVTAKTYTHNELKKQQDTRREIIVNGYVYPSVNLDLLREISPDLTAINLFSYGITENGDLLPLNDGEVVRVLKENNVAPVMVLTSLTDEGTFRTDILELILDNESLQNKLIDQILQELRAKGLYGVDFDFEYVEAPYKDKYAAFIAKTRERLNQEGYQVSAAVAPKVFADQKGLLYEGHDYAAIGRAANLVLAMTYEWGYTYGPPMAVAPLNKVREVLDYAVTEIPPEKLLMGIPNYGYDWTLPFVQGESKARILSNVDAQELARQQGAQIQFDPVAQAPYFTYTDEQGRPHEVWFEDARSIQAKLNLVDEYGLAGVAYWNLVWPFPENWKVIEENYDVKKVV
ncbi:glycosyl hydrolase family 18 protein [Sinanaerobacter sp. ZZT-01]|uniref:glycosyl hydrolase family 18 protein n=1 Tax=Sinanaerobacter sp. ZZT-01 TaxID=3111540 RepID=UPI002D790E61|nr:glycosyl hydrolase family 18 protein [Sinanaerobacter sp. ZZT-01]WRR92466.1 glycosyl hydrolase family 18 protein [Sinanaerobacter sp. ZZT-01]